MEQHRLSVCGNKVLSPSILNYVVLSKIDFC